MIRSATAVRRALSALPASGPGPGELGRLLSEVLAPVVPHEGARLLGYSSARNAQLASFDLGHGYAPELAAALDNALFAGVDPYRRPVLERLPLATAVVGGDSPRDGRMRQLLRRHGAGCELRLLLRDSRGEWGLLCLLRGEGSRAFSAEEVALLAGLTPVLIDLLRWHVTSAPLVFRTPAPPAGVLLVGPDHQVRSMTASARRWLDLMAERSPGRDWATALPMMMSLLARESRPELFPFISPAASFGRWTSVSGEVMAGAGGDLVAVVIESAGGELVLPALCHWYDITEREQRVLRHSLDGSPTKLIARGLGLSTHTVSEHLQSVYRKTGASSRGELISALAG